MSSLQTSRVVVIDEDAAEARVLLQSLGSLGIGAVLVTGEKEQLPKKPLTGVRLVFLDLQLTSQVESSKYLDETVAVLRASVQLTAGTTGIVCWTKHKDDIEGLKDRFKHYGIQPAFLEIIDDKKKLVDAGLNGVAEIVSRIEKILTSLPGRSLLFDWEQGVHNAATDAVDGLIASAARSSGTAEGAAFDSEILRRVGAIAIASAEEKIKTPEQAVVAAFTGLTPILADSIESTQISKSSQHDKLLTEVQGLRKNRISSKNRASLNSVLLAAAVSDKTPRPGNLYVPQAWTPKESFPYLIDSAQSRGLIRELFQIHGETGEEKAKVDGLVTGLQPCMLEITPACDHAAGKVEHARLLPGVLLPLPDLEELEYARALPAGSRTFAKDTEYFEIHGGGLDGAFRIILLARRILALPLSDLGKHAPALRLRHPVVADVRAWFASHAARPGYVSVR